MVTTQVCTSKKAMTIYHQSNSKAYPVTLPDRQNAQNGQNGQNPWLGIPGILRNLTLLRVGTGRLIEISRWVMYREEMTMVPNLVCSSREAMPYTIKLIQNHIQCLFSTNGMLRTLRMVRMLSREYLGF
jgi:hypothetical protein